MKSLHNSPEEYKEKVLKIAMSKPRYNNVLPERFIKKLKEHHASANDIDENGLYKRNPLIVALGDSITAGAFEGNAGLPQELLDKYFDGEEIAHVLDFENVYHEKFKQKLLQKFTSTVVSVINSGIGGDTVVGMNSRLERDVLCHHPDLVIINAVVNGPADIEQYKANYREIVDRIMKNTEADIILMTPSMVRKDFMVGQLEDRVKIVRTIAEEKKLCIADAYAVWEQFENNGIELQNMLSNRLNHPTILGHEVFAVELMKLF